MPKRAHDGPMVNYSLKLEPKLRDALKYVKFRDGISESEQIRRALKAWWAERGLTLKEDAPVYGATFSPPATRKGATRKVK